MTQQINVHNLTYRYAGSPDPAVENISLTVPAGWTGVLGANGSGKTTLVRLATGDLLATTGTVVGPKSALYVPQKTEAPPNGGELFSMEWDGVALELKESLEIGHDWFYRWETLSHGERKRYQIGVALWKAPEILAIDEPTNHLDAESRGILLRGLQAYRGIGLLVSHDRQLLDLLTERTVVVSGGSATLRRGSVSQAAEEERREQLEARRERQNARDERRRIATEYHRRRQAADQRRSGFSKRNLDRQDSAGRFAIDVSRITGKDKRAGELKGQMDKRLEAAEERVEKSAGTPPPVLTASAHLSLEGEKARGDALFALKSGTIPLGPNRGVWIPELALGPSESVWLSGPNGSGKSTLLRRVLAELRERERNLLYLPQEFLRPGREELRRRFASLGKEDLGRVLATVDSLGSDPRRILDARRWSPGEERKITLALAVLSSPEVLVLDEPTNHLDLPSILSLEEALSRLPSALLLVTHDESFGAALGAQRWRIEVGKGGKNRLLVDG